jgi:hypothetical protein
LAIYKSGGGMLSGDRSLIPGNATEFPNMHSPIVIDGFLTSHDIDHGILPGLSHLDGGDAPRLVDVSQSVLDIVKSAMERAGLRANFKLVGSLMTYGCSDQGMHEHADEPLQGGDYSILIYLSDVPGGSGGETVFDTCNEHITPRKGRAVLFDIHLPHRASPVTNPFYHKNLLAFELTNSTVRT